MSDVVTGEARRVFPKSHQYFIQRCFPSVTILTTSQSHAHCLNLLWVCAEDKLTHVLVCLCVCVCVSHGRADDLSSDLCLRGLAVQSLHGDREQCDREEALKDFKESMKLASV